MLKGTFHRRQFIAGVATAGFVVPAAAAPAELGLKDYAARGQLTFGSAIGIANFPLPECRALYKRETRLVTTDQALKFALLRPAPDVFDFERADAVIAWAGHEGLQVRGHTLIWNDDIPDWLNRLSAKEITRVFDEHIDRVVSRYVGRVHIWDVVNEPFWPDFGEPGGWRRGPWYKALGPGYVARALKRVRAIDKTAKLCVNEAQVDSDHPWGRAIRPALSRLVADLRQAGTPFDVLGLQCHLQPGWPHDYRRFADYMRQLAAESVELHVTEFDISDDAFPAPIAERDAMVAAHADTFLQAVLPVRDLTTFVTWELADQWSWIWRQAADANPGAARLPRPLPFDEHLERKPLWRSLARAFDAREPA